MSLDYINMAFKRLDALDEEMFNLDNSEFADFQDFVYDSANDEEVVNVIDKNADTEEDLQDSYVGKVILNCNVCHSNIFEDKEEIVLEEDTGKVNPEMNCPYCNEQEGFMILGEIVPFTSDTENTSDNESEESTVETTEESQPDSLTEDFKEVSITTDDQHMEMFAGEDGKVTVTTEPVHSEPEAGEKIAPVSDATIDDIVAMNTSEENGEEEFTDVDFDEFSEEDFNDLGESYLKEVYENVESFKTTDVMTKENSLIVEGVIRFTSGVQKKTGFIFEAKDMTTDGKLMFEGQNKHLSESLSAFCLTANLDNKKLCLESLNYNYNIGDKAVRGCVSKK